MSAAIDTIEGMFDSGSVSAAALALPDPAEPIAGSADDGATAAAVPDRDGADRTGTIDALRARIRGMERRGLREESGLPSVRIPTHPAIASLLPGAAMRAGAVYSVGHSAALTMAMLAAPSRAGLWAAVVGMPEFGVESAVEAGIRLDRLVLVPRPGEQWIATVGVLAEVMGVIAVRAPRGAAPGALDRLSARLRRHGCTLVVAGERLGGDAVLAVESSRWRGIGRGHGFLAERELTIRATVGGASTGTAVLRIVDEASDGGTAAAGADAGSAIAVPAIAPRASARPPVPGLRRLEATG